MTLDKCPQLKFRGNNIKHKIMRNQSYSTKSSKTDTIHESMRQIKKIRVLIRQNAQKANRKLFCLRQNVDTKLKLCQIGSIQIYHVTNTDLYKIKTFVKLGRYKCIMLLILTCSYHCANFFKKGRLEA